MEIALAVIDPVVIPSRLIPVRDTAGEFFHADDLAIRMLIGLYADWPYTLSGSRPGSPANYHIHRDVLPSRDSGTGVLTPSNYIIWDPSISAGNKWTDFSKSVVSRAILTFAGGALATDLATAAATAATALANANSAIATLAGLVIPGVFTGASSGAAGTTGLVPQPIAGDQVKVLYGDRSWKIIPAFGGASGGAAGTSGMPRAPTAGENLEVFYGDGDFKPLPAFGGASGGAAGTSGMPRAPIAGENLEVFYGDGDFKPLPAFQGATGGAAGASGMPRAPAAGENAEVFWGDGDFKPLPVMVGASSTVAGIAGIAPTPAAGTENSFLKGNATYGTPAVMSFATSSVAGAAGLVPAPAAGANDLYLSGEGFKAVRNADQNSAFLTITPGGSGDLAGTIHGAWASIASGDVTVGATGAGTYFVTLSRASTTGTATLTRSGATVISFAGETGSRSTVLTLAASEVLSCTNTGAAYDTLIIHRMY